MRKTIALIIILNLLGCKKANRQENIAIFFNPVSIKPYSYHLIILSKKQILIDTTIKSSFIDQSVLMKCFNSEKIDNLIIRLNNKKREININSFLKRKGQTSIFIRYDSRIKLDSIFQSYTRKSIKTTGHIPIYRTFVDSLKSGNTFTDKYDSLMVYVKNEGYWCGKK